MHERQRARQHIWTPGENSSGSNDQSQQKILMQTAAVTEGTGAAVGSNS